MKEKFKLRRSIHDRVNDVDLFIETVKMVLYLDLVYLELLMPTQGKFSWSDCFHVI